MTYHCGIHVMYKCEYIIGLQKFELTTFYFGEWAALLKRLTGKNKVKLGSPISAELPDVCSSHTVTGQKLCKSEGVFQITIHRLVANLSNI